jgi:hypothetical protein
MALPFDSGRTKGVIAGNWALILIILAALGIRTIFFVSLKPWDNDVAEHRVLTDDARSYHFLATGIAETGTFDRFDGGFYLRTPGYPLFIAGVYIFSGQRPWVVLTALLGLSLMFRERKTAWALLLTLSIAYFTLVPGVFCLCRFRIPAIPFYMIASA